MTRDPGPTLSDDFINFLQIGAAGFPRTKNTVMPLTHDGEGLDALLQQFSDQCDVYCHVQLLLHD